MFDTHCHLNFKAFEGRVAEILGEAKKAGVDKIIVPGADLNSSQRAVEIAQQYDNVWAAVGIHPHHARDCENKDLNKLKKLAQEDKVVAIGEIGLDYHKYKKTRYNNSTVTQNLKQKQAEVLEKQIRLAQKLNKPLIFHNREAKVDFLTVLEKIGWENLSGQAVFHCCEPDQQLLTIAQQYQIFIGVDGDVTYNNRKNEFTKQVPLDRLVLETDSPYLTPEPARSKNRFPNKPANLIHTANYIAKIKGVKRSRLEKITTQNTLSLFNLSRP